MTLLACILAYLLGSVPNGLILCRAIWHIDIREHGSRNIGATNVYRTLGKGPGAVVFLLDFLKGFLGVYIAMLLVGTPLAMVIGGIAAILGHSASVFLRFKGGKGVATGLGVIAMLMPAVTGIVFFAWLGIVFVTRYVSLGSIVGAALVPIFAFLFAYPTEYLAFGVLAAVLVIVRHHTNITRLLNGTESKIKAGHR
ncbi:glycerol-3-phosphate 1-O-acyltransferase PlsY [Selenomonas sp.]|uniref:glycerol-3-phosphate 1-O-acyltransferase PlsY n=1 Tax=Selenomonas sp. TaxID=2053611 RepID=UPI003FA1E4B1